MQNFEQERQTKSSNGTARHRRAETTRSKQNYGMERARESMLKREQNIPTTKKYENIRLQKIE